MAEEIPTVSDEMVAAVQRAVPRRDGDWYGYEVAALLTAVRPLIEAEVRQQIAADLQAHRDQDASTACCNGTGSCGIGHECGEDHARFVAFSDAIDIAGDGA